VQRHRLSPPAGIGRHVKTGVVGGFVFEGGGGDVVPVAGVLWMWMEREGLDAVGEAGQPVPQAGRRRRIPSSRTASCKAGVAGGQGDASAVARRVS